MKMRFTHVAAAILLGTSTATAKSIAERDPLGDLTSAYFYYCTPPLKPPATTQPPSLPEGVFILDVDITVNVYVTVFVDVCPEIGVCHLQYTLTHTCSRTSICHPPPIPPGFTVTEKSCDIYGQPSTITVTEPCAASPPPNCPQWPPIPEQVPPPAFNSGPTPPHISVPGQYPPNFDNQGKQPPNSSNKADVGDQNNPAASQRPTQAFNPYLPSMSGMPQASPALPPSLPSMTGSSTGPLRNSADRICNSQGIFTTVMLALIATIMFTL